jgi:hypothetical protein
MSQTDENIFIDIEQAVERLCDSKELNPDPGALLDMVKELRKRMAALRGDAQLLYRSQQLATAKLGAIQLVLSSNG